MKMKRLSEKRTPRALEHKAAQAKPANYVLRLYVSGMSPRSALAVENVEAVCQEYLPGRYRLEVIDIYQNQARMREDQVIAAPTLIREGPAPLKRLVGDMSDRARVLAGLGLKPVSA